MTKRNIAIMAVVLLLLAVTLVFASPNIVEEKSVLTGVVVADHLVTVGQTVKEGDALVCISTITGTATAARATSDGTVVSVLVAPGAKIKTGDVVAKIEKSRK